eukprot:jgi/Bigna1/83469/fgenesh1_pg.109_\
MALVASRVASILMMLLASASSRPAPRTSPSGQRWRDNAATRVSLIVSRKRPIMHSASTNAAVQGPTAHGTLNRSTKVASSVIPPPPSAGRATGGDGSNDDDDLENSDVKPEVIIIHDEDRIKCLQYWIELLESRSALGLDESKAIMNKMLWWNEGSIGTKKRQFSLAVVRGGAVDAVVSLKLTPDNSDFLSFLGSKYLLTTEYIAGYDGIIFNDI